MGPHDGISAFIRRVRVTRVFSICEVRTQGEGRHPQASKQASPRTESASALILDFQPPDHQNKCLLFKPYSL